MLKICYEIGKSALCIVAHPDDAEFQCAGTLALLAEKGWKIVIATMTPGQAGSEKIGPEEISRIRHLESANMLKDSVSIWVSVTPRIIYLNQN